MSFKSKAIVLLASGVVGLSIACTDPVPPPVVTPPPVGTNWQPPVSTTWQWQLNGTLNTSYNVGAYDIDLFDTPVSTIQGLHARGIKVICYFSAGSSENWRPDYYKFLPSDMGNPLDGWAGERWLNTRSSNVRSIMSDRLEFAVTKGCDAVEPDNVDAYTNNSGFPLTAATQKDYNLFLASEAHKRGLAVALKNDIDQVVELSPHFDFAVNEQCNQYDECGVYQSFVSQGKAVFNAEYAKKYVNDLAKRAALCAKSKANHIRTLILPLNLDGSFRISCDE